jgi:hypothetical protein
MIHNSQDFPKNMTRARWGKQYRKFTYLQIQIKTTDHYNLEDHHKETKAKFSDHGKTLGVG